MPGKAILVLAGTAEAREAANALVGRGFDVVTSLAGVTRNPRMPNGEVRVGGFGGVEGLAAYLAERGIGLIADATHPFAAIMSRHAVEAAQQTGTRYIRLERPAWSSQPGDRWTVVADIEAAAAAVLPGSRVFLTIGRKELTPFLARRDLSGLIRSIEPPGHRLPPNWTVLLARPPFRFEDEEALMAAHGITVLVAKNSGGQTEPKLDAARRLGLPVIMIDRPPKPDAKTAPDVEELLELIGRPLPA